VLPLDVWDILVARATVLVLRGILLYDLKGEDYDHGILCPIGSVYSEYL
jgi:hypothetical protein